jgi:hypothetical protein
MRERPRCERGCGGDYRPRALEVRVPDLRTITAPVAAAAASPAMAIGSTGEVPVSVGENPLAWPPVTFVLSSTGG